MLMTDRHKSSLLTLIVTAFSLLILNALSMQVRADSIPLADRAEGVYIADFTDCHMTDLGNGVWGYQFTVVPYKSPTSFQTQVTKSNGISINIMKWSGVPQIYSFQSQTSVTSINSISNPQNWTPPAQYSFYSSQMETATKELTYDPIIGWMGVLYGVYTPTTFTGTIKISNQDLNPDLFPGIMLYSAISTYQRVLNTPGSPPVTSIRRYMTFDSNGNCKPAIPGEVVAPPIVTDPKFSLQNGSVLLNLGDINKRDLPVVDNSSTVSTGLKKSNSNDLFCIEYDKAAVNSTQKWILGTRSSGNAQVQRGGKNLYTMFGPQVESTGKPSEAYYSLEILPTNVATGMGKQMFPKQTSSTDTLTDLSKPNSVDATQTRNKACWSGNVYLFQGGENETGPGLHSDTLTLTISPST